MPDSLSETADLLGFSHATVSSVGREWCEKIPNKVLAECIIYTIPLPWT